MASTNSAALGFMDWPPSITASYPSSRNSALLPSPAATATNGHAAVETKPTFPGAGLLAHVGDLDVVDSAVRRRVPQYLAGVVGVHVDSEHAFAPRLTRAQSPWVFTNRFEVVAVEVVADQRKLVQ